MHVAVVRGVGSSFCSLILKVGKKKRMSFIRYSTMDLFENNPCNNMVAKWSLLDVSLPPFPSLAMCFSLFLFLFCIFFHMRLQEDVFGSMDDGEFPGFLLHSVGFGLSKDVTVKVCCWF